MNHKNRRMRKKRRLNLSLLIAFGSFLLSIPLSILTNAVKLPQDFNPIPWLIVCGCFGLALLYFDHWTKRASAAQKARKSLSTSSPAPQVPSPAIRHTIDLLGETAPDTNKRSHSQRAAIFLFWIPMLLILLILGNDLATPLLIPTFHTNEQLVQYYCNSLEKQEYVHTFASFQPSDPGFLSYNFEVSLGDLPVTDESTFEYAAKTADKQGIVIRCVIKDQRILQQETQYIPPDDTSGTGDHDLIYTTYMITLQVTRKGQIPYESHLKVLQQKAVIHDYTYNRPTDKPYHILPFGLSFLDVYPTARITAIDVL